MVICPKGIFISCELPDINDHLHVSMSISKMYNFKKYFYPKPAYVKRKLISPLLIFSLSLPLHQLIRYLYYHGNIYNYHGNRWSFLEHKVAFCALLSDIFLLKTILQVILIKEIIKYFMEKNMKFFK